MDGLLPIIRRVRRPLLPTEATADAKPVEVKAFPASQPAAAGEGAPENDSQLTRKDKRGKVASSESGK
jgi:hypothetical protein